MQGQLDPLYKLIYDQNLVLHVEKSQIEEMTFSEPEQGVNAAASFRNRAGNVPYIFRHFLR